MACLKLAFIQAKTNFSSMTTFHVLGSIPDVNAAVSNEEFIFRAFVSVMPRESLDSPLLYRDAVAYSLTYLRAFFLP